VSQRDKLLGKARANPRGLRFSEFEVLLRQCGWRLDRQQGSQRIWVSRQGKRLPVQEAKAGEAKAYQVKQFLQLLEEEA
jgi:predicted RNA binding protein YcfA (HicA-like mRNA interferase family)